MNLTYSNDGESVLRRYEYADQWVVVADLGVGDEQIDVDTVGDTAIVVIDNGSNETESEIELPGPATTVDINNGVLTITIEKQ